MSGCFSLRNVAKAGDKALKRPLSFPFTNLIDLETGFIVVVFLRASKFWANRSGDIGTSTVSALNE